MKKINYKLFPDSKGHFDKFGGKYVSETLMHPLSELDKAYKKIAKSTVSLPVHEHLNKKNLDKMISKIKFFMNK